jgi:hypothetical protein
VECTIWSLKPYLKGKVQLTFIESKKKSSFNPELTNGASFFPHRDPNLAGQVTVPAKSVGLKMAV